MPRMNFDQLLDYIQSDVFAGKVCADTRKLVSGDVFVAVRGSSVDGHGYIELAIDKGAAWIVCEEMPSSNCDKCIVVEDSSLALGLLAQAACGNPAKKMVNLAVTGTNGKTTVAFITRSIVKSAGAKCGLIGTIEYDTCSDSKGAIPAPLTTPDAITIAGLTEQMVEAGAGYMVTEASSHALSQNRLGGIGFKAAAFTNLTGDHLDYHKTKELYLAEKTKLFTGLDSNAYAILNKQSDEAFSIVEKTRAKVLWYAVGEMADIWADVLSMDAGGTVYELAYDGQMRTVKTSLIGMHNISNQLAAAGLCFGAGFGIDEVVRGIEQIGCVPGRLESVCAGQDYAVLIDYAHTDDALKNMLMTLKPICKNKLIVLFGCGGDRDTTKRPRMAAAAEEYGDIIIVTSDNPRNESAEAIIDDVLAGFSDSSKENIFVEVDRRKAIALAVKLANKDDVVLLAGKGHEKYQIIGNEKIDFDEKKIAIEFIVGENV